MINNSYKSILILTCILIIGCCDDNHQEESNFSVKLNQDNNISQNQTNDIEMIVVGILDEGPARINKSNGEWYSSFNKLMTKCFPEYTIIEINKIRRGYILTRKPTFWRRGKTVNYTTYSIVLKQKRKDIKQR